MKLQLITITNKYPAWVQAGYLDYAKRLPPHYALELVEIAAEKRGPSCDIKRVMEREANKILATIKEDTRVIALDIKGQMWSTEQLAKNLHAWHQDGRDLSLLIGGPEGLAPSCLQKAEMRWSLSPLTFPH